MDDPTESIRRERLAGNQHQLSQPREMEAAYGKVWDTQQLAEDFSITGFLAPFVVVRRKADGVVGSLEFQHLPRLFFNLEPG